MPTQSVGHSHRLTGFAQGTSSASYAYNGDGLRMSKTVGTTLEPFAWDIAEGLPLLLVDGSTSYVTGPGGMPLEQVTGTAVLFYHQDQLGSSRMLTDSTGAVQATYTYTAYGTLSSSTGLVNQPFGFAGQYSDGETGLYYMRARYYDPVTAQFLSRDPATGITRAPHTYVHDDPLNIVDPGGLLTAEDCGSFSDNASVLSLCVAVVGLDQRRQSLALQYALLQHLLNSGQLDCDEQITAQAQASATVTEYANLVNVENQAGQQLNTLCNFGYCHTHDILATIFHVGEGVVAGAAIVACLSGPCEVGGLAGAGAVIVGGTLYALHGAYNEITKGAPY